MAQKRLRAFLSHFFTVEVVTVNGSCSAAFYESAALQEKYPVSNGIRNFSREGFSRENGVQESPQTFLNPEIKIILP